MKKLNLKDKIKRILWFFANPRLLLCFGIAWIFTNGWSYIALGIGTIFDIVWMQAVAGAYLALLWLPFTPEKIITVIIAIALLKLFFPRDERTLGILNDIFAKAKEKLKRKKTKKRKQGIK